LWIITTWYSKIKCIRNGAFFVFNRNTWPSMEKV